MKKIILVLVLTLALPLGLAQAQTADGLGTDVPSAALDAPTQQDLDLQNSIEDLRVEMRRALADTRSFAEQVVTETRKLTGAVVSHTTKSTGLTDDQVYGIMGGILIGAVVADQTGFGGIGTIVAAGLGGFIGNWLFSPLPMETLEPSSLELPEVDVTP